VTAKRQNDWRGSYSKAWEKVLGGSGKNSGILAKGPLWERLTGSFRKKTLEKAEKGKLALRAKKSWNHPYSGLLPEDRKGKRKKSRRRGRLGRKDGIGKKGGRDR